MRQLKERITHAFTLAPLPPRDVKDYVSFRLRAAGYHGPDLFGPEALAIIADASEGLTRRINIYADKTLLAAFAAGTHTVSPDHARAAVSDTQIVVTRKPATRPVALAAAAGLVAGIALGFVLGRSGLSTPGATPAIAATPAVTAAPTAAPPPAGTLAAAEKTPPALKPVEAKAAEPKPAAASASATGDAVLQRLAAGRDLLAADAPGYGVQLMVTDAREKAYLENYLAEAGRALKPTALYLFPAGSRDTPRIGVLYGTFGERAEATAALDAMPPNLKQFRPYVRPLDGVRDDVRRVEKR
jgi:septal ring-binding cell division protein DamX